MIEMDHAFGSDSCGDNDRLITMSVAVDAVHGRVLSLRPKKRVPTTNVPYRVCGITLIVSDLWSAI